MSPSVICISTIAERHYCRDYQPINGPFVTNNGVVLVTQPRRKVSSVKNRPVLGRRAPKPISDLPFRHRAVVCAARYSARPNCRVFNNDVNERCVSRPVGPTRRPRSQARAQPGPALLIRLKANRIFLPTVTFSLPPAPLSTSVETVLFPTPMAIPIVAHAYRVLVYKRRKWKKKKSAIRTND